MFDEQLYLLLCARRIEVLELAHSDLGVRSTVMLAQVCLVKARLCDTWAANDGLRTRCMSFLAQMFDVQVVCHIYMYMLQPITSVDCKVVVSSLCLPYCLCVYLSHTLTIISRKSVRTYLQS